MKKAPIKNHKLTKNQRLAKAVRLLLNGSADDRLYASSKSFPIFFLTYYSHVVKAVFGDFHYDIFDDLSDIATGKLYEYALVAFRFSAKSTILKAYLAWLACFKKRNCIIVTSYDSENSETILNDVANNLTELGNPLLYHDMYHMYGQKLFTKEREKDQMTVRANGIFQLTNGVWFEAGSVNTVFRGRNKNGQRPDLILMDDIENTRTVASADITMKIRKQMDELRSAGDIMTATSVIYLGNKISKYGNVAYLEECSTKYPKFKYKEIPLVDDNGVIAWKAFTPERIQELRESFADTFNAEFLNKPDDVEAIFKPSADALRACVENVAPKKDRIVIGMDTGKKKYIVVGDAKGLFINDFCEDYSQLEYYLDKYDDSIAVLDGQGDPTKTAEMIAKYPGRVFPCYFRMDGKSEEFVKLREDDGSIIADRNRLITWTYDEFATGRTTLHGDIEYWDELYIPHWTNMYRISKPTSIGMRKVWERKGGDHLNGDHLALATVYWRAGVAVLPEYTGFSIINTNSLELQDYYQ